VNQADSLRLKFIHGVLCMGNQAILFLAREELSGRIHLFFISAGSNSIFRRNGLARRWEKMDNDNLIAIVLNAIQEALNNDLVIIRTRQDYQSLLGRIEA